MSRCLETQRLLFRGIRDADIDLLVGMLASPKVTQWLFSGAPMDTISARLFIEKEFTFGDKLIGLGTLCEKTPDRFIGFAGIIPCRYLDVEDFEFGFALNEDSWGKGYATEIGQAQIKYSFANLPVDRLLALAHPRNLASLKVIEHIGMRFLKEILTEQRGPRLVYAIERAGH
jgi:[ribosomal protein S5]-alanine N-acetyltransferase